MKKLFVLCAAAIFVVAFTAPSFAAEWSFYGHARMATFWTDSDFGDGNPYKKTDGEDEDFDLSHGLQGNSRIGANVKAGDNLTGRFEYGTGINLRILWGEYDFGGWKLGVGQHYTPLCMFISNQVYGADAGLLDVGGVYNGRRPMVQAKFGGFKIALVEPVTDAILAPTAASWAKDPDTGVWGEKAATDGAVETDVTIPMIQAKYTFKAGGLGIQLSGGYQTYDVVDVNDDDDDVSSYIFAIGATYNMGPLYLGADGWMGQNTANMGMAAWGFAPDISAGVGADGVLDNDSYGFLVAAGFTMSDMLYFEGGIGYVNADLDDADEEDETLGYYIQAKINFAKNVWIVPEIGYYDLKDDAAGNDEGSVTYYGLQWQIRF